MLTTLSLHVHQRNSLATLTTSRDYRILRISLTTLTTSRDYRILRINAISLLLLLTISRIRLLEQRIDVIATTFLSSIH